ncbi:MAG: DNA repair protein RadC [Gemmatimonadetes bacterium]|nr:DNA repair protein RadC [Gemmatimonadota bacterium]
MSTRPDPSPSADRPRERLARHGPAALTTAELLAILLGTGRAGHAVEAVAESILRGADGSLRRLVRQPLGQLRRVAGVGGAKAGRVAAALELGRRLAREERPVRVRIRTPEDVVRLLVDRLRDLEVEEFHVVALSAQRDVLKDLLVSRGVLTGSLVHPREVFRPAIAEAAAGIIVVHNHPSGDPTPSPEDRAVTGQLTAAGTVLGIPVLDHVIVAGDRWMSFASQGLL